jgi:AP-1 complex subunit gamma-1
VICTALTIVGNIATADMCRELSEDVAKLMFVESSYVRKRAVLAGARVVELCPDLAEDYAPRLAVLIQDSSHGVIMNTMTMVTNILRANPDMTA